MTLNLETLDVNESYDFEVVVEDVNQSFAGKLCLTPYNITLTIMGELSKARNCSIRWKNVDELHCRDLNKRISLFNLKLTGGTTRRISRSSENIIDYFEVTFDVGFAVYSLEDIHEKTFKRIMIDSETINNWVGNTNSQEEIIRKYHNKESSFLGSGELDEFFVHIKNKAIIGVSYHCEIYVSSPEFKSGIAFPPYVHVSYHEGIKLSKIKLKLDETLNLLSFLTGNELSINKINVILGSGMSSHSGSLYCPLQKDVQNNSRNPIFYPLGKDLRLTHNNLPPMSLDTLSNYFALSGEDMGYFGKYIRYRNMKNPEDRFLGFFRILESNCTKKIKYLDEQLLESVCLKLKPYLYKVFNDKKNVDSFIKNLPRYNNSKYNTEKCIQDFYLSIPSDLTKNWKFQKKDIGLICGLRNNITHANDYYVSDVDLEEKTKFIEILLIFSLCSKIGIRHDITSKLIDRISGYKFILGKEVESPLRLG